MNAMEKFVSTVQEMDETILVPCRLMDLKVGDSSDQLASTEGCKSEVQAVMNHADLYSLYTMVNKVKNELLWGQKSQPTNYPNVIKTHSRNSSASNIKPEKQTTQQGHQRRPSTGSLVSTHSLTSMSLSDTDSEAGNENDSGIEDGSGVDPTLQIALNFRKHLSGLYKSLDQLTQAASYLTQRYQHDIGGNV
ncbi:UNVERIFIED_CONTAM: hypothetical protein PYX00_009861 [Menopon gallinae]|uniref:Mid1-interacting protein 1 n=1 Tax=Menopon gallinae TaxID=328185 RepID=A0AAW2HCM2_9NEOP